MVALVAPTLAFVRRHWRPLILGVAGVLVLLLAGLLLSAGQVPIPDRLPLPEASKVVAADGSLIGMLHGTENRTVVSLDQISPNLRQAVVSAEDRTFYHEGGFSPRGILRAVFTDVRSGGAAEGGSTITQQYVRNAFSQVGTNRTLARKLKEVVLAIKLDRKYSKDKILEFYLNTVYWGRGAYGAEAASQAYFGVAAKDLTLPQAAFLAGILRSPQSYQPDQNPAGVTRLRQVVSDDLRRDHIVNSAADAASVASSPLDFSKGTTGPTTTRAAYFMEYVRRYLLDTVHLTDQEILTGGLQITTTLDLQMQDAAEKAIATTLDKATDPEAALVAMDTEGNVRAMVGGRDLTSVARAQGFNFAYQRSGATGGRQAGSSFKPFTLAAFVQAGYSINSRFPGPTSIQIDSPQCRNPDGPWQVSNFNKESFPSLDMTEATAHSVNTIYAQVIDKLGPRKVTDLAQAAGGWTNLDPVCSITLGTSPVTPLEMARAYASFAGRGRRPDALSVTKITAPDGKVLFQASVHKDQAFDANVADTVNKVLGAVLDHGTAEGKGISRPAAGKTGTTENQNDAWFVGYTPNLVAAVWMGFPPDPTTGKTPAMTNVRGGPVTGGSFPATIWQKFMAAAVAGTPKASFVQPKIGGKLLGVAPTCGDPSASPPVPCPAPSPAQACSTPGVQPSPSCTTPSPDTSPLAPGPATSPDAGPVPFIGPSPVPFIAPTVGPSPVPGPPVPVPGPSPAPKPPPPAPVPLGTPVPTFTGSPRGAVAP